MSNGSSAAGPGTRPVAGWSLVDGGTRMSTDRLGEANVPQAYVDMLAHDHHDNVPAFLHAASELFDGIDLRGRSVLEIGSGRGLLAILMGMCGAGRVVSLEPELVGASSGVIALQRQRIEQLGLDNVTVVAADFNTWTWDGAPFDFILSRASLNHLHASDRHALRDRRTFDAYVRVAGRIHALLASGGVFVATDACRYAFFTGVRDLGIQRPWRPERTGIDWRHHQNPGTWRRIFHEAGFGRVAASYPVPYRLRRFRPVVATCGANFFLNGSFVLRAYRQGVGGQ